jgi:heme exporter protein A
MQQRLAIGRAVLRPDVMLFDEPHTGLDQDASTMDNVLRQVAASGRTVVMTSHDLALPDLASRFDVLSRSKIAASIQRTEISPDGLLAFYRQALVEA